MNETLTTVEAVIAKFGGPTKMGKIFGVRPSAVCNWQAAERFPERLHYRISLEADARGIAIDPQVFTPTPTEARAS